MTGPARRGNVGSVARIGVYPGSFNPPTVAHVEIALAARRVHDLRRVDLAVSVVPLGKEDVAVPRLEHRLEVLEATVARVPGLGLRVTEHQLIADIAEGYDVVVMGADKWAEVNDPSWYDDHRERDAALARLPTLALAPRRPHTIPDEHRLPVADDLLEVSSTGARRGRVEWMTEAAADFDRRTGAWSDEERYEEWLRRRSRRGR